MTQNTLDLAYQKPINFTASGIDYCKLYWFNFFFSVITLGIYSAWAKVHTSQYLYAHFKIDNSAFDFRPNPLVILRGRIIGLLILIPLYTLEYFSFKVIIISFVVYFILLPFFVIGALRFKSTNTYHCNLQFNFTGKYWEAFVCFSLLGILSIFSLGLLYPYYEYLKRKFIHNHYYYADQKFEFSGRLRDFYKIFLGAVLIFLLFMMPFIVLTLYEFEYGSDLSTNIKNLAFLSTLSTLLRGWLIVIPFYIAFQYIHIKYINYSLNHTRIGKLQIHSDLKFRKLLHIVTMNSVLIILTLGLFAPWAKVRKLQYIYSNIFLHSDAAAEDIKFGDPSKVSALGEAMDDALGLDIGL